jgi:hypothetical protein
MSSKAFEARQTPAFKSTVGDRVYTPQQVQQTRTTYYTTVYRDRYIPPMYGVSYGSFSEQFMWAMMFDSMFAHNHSDDPAYRQWRRDADERALSDQKVKDQLAELDRKMNAMASAPKDPNYIPPDVPPEVIFTDAALTNKPEHNSGHSFWVYAAGTGAAGGIGWILYSIFWRRRRLA